MGPLSRKLQGVQGLVHTTDSGTYPPSGLVHTFFLFLTFIEPHGATTHGELNQPSPQFQADRPQSVKVYGHIEGHSNLMLMLILLKVTNLEVLTVVEGLVTIPP